MAHKATNPVKEATKVVAGLTTFAAVLGTVYVTMPVRLIPVVGEIVHHGISHVAQHAGNEVIKKVGEW